MFKNVKVGDRVWHLQWGWGTVYKLSAIDDHYSFKVRFDRVGDSSRIKLEASFTPHGKYMEDDELPTLFWQPVEIVPPERPKTKVKKEIVLKNIQWNTSSGTVYPFVSSKLAIRGCLPEDFTWSGLINKPPMTMTLEWEEDE